MPLAFGADSVTWSTHGPARPGSEPPPAACETPLNTCARKRAQHSWRGRRGGAPGRNQPGGPPDGRTTILRPTFHSATLIGVARISCRRGRLRGDSQEDEGRGKRPRTAVADGSTTALCGATSASAVSGPRGSRLRSRGGDTCGRVYAQSGCRRGAGPPVALPRRPLQASPLTATLTAPGTWPVGRLMDGNGGDSAPNLRRAVCRDAEPGSKLRNLRRVGRAPESVSSSSQGTGPSPRWGVKCGNVESG